MHARAPKIRRQSWINRTVKRSWQFSWLNLAIVVLVLLGLGLVMYPTVAGWVSQYNQSRVLATQTQANSKAAQAALREMYQQAVDYNGALQSGALLESGASVASGTGTTDAQLDYWKTLDAEPSHIMGRLRMSAIDLDLPIYHGTSEATLLAGVGHLEGTSLPVGGPDTRAVLTAHRGLANAVMFTHLDKVKKGDLFSVEVLGEVLTYKVGQIQVVDPEDSEKIRPVAGKDLITLVTCTPLGINTQRILVTGERVTPAPESEIEAMKNRPDVPGFPWWALISGGVILGSGLWFWRSGYRSLSVATGVA